MLLVLGVGLLLPNNYNVSRSIVISSSKENIHKYAGNLKQWDLWMPWEEEDPIMELVKGGITQGVGAYKSWKGKDGNGELTFV